MLHQLLLDRQFTMLAVVVVLHTEEARLVLGLSRVAINSSSGSIVGCCCCGGGGGTGGMAALGSN